MRKVKIIILIVVVSLISWPKTVLGQLTQFTQNNFTSERFNPGTLSFAGVSSVKLLHRRQSFLSADRLVTNYLSLNYSNPSGKSGFSISYVGDQSSSFNFFSTQEGAFYYAKAVEVTPTSKISLGAGFSFSNTSLNLSGFSTSSQFVTGRGFDRLIENGEIDNTNNQRDSRFHTGVVYQKYNKKDYPIMEAGIALKDINYSTSGTGGENFTNIIGHLIRKFPVGKSNFVGGEIYYNRINTDNSLILGTVLNHRVSWSQKHKFWHDEVQFNLRYHTIGYASFAMQVRKKAMLIGLSHDFYNGKSPINNGTEIALSYEFKSLEIHFKKKRKRRRKGSPIPPRKPTYRKSNNPGDSATSNDTLENLPVEEEVTADNEPENDGPEDVDKLVENHDFNIELGKLYMLSFEFGSHDLTDASATYLEYVKHELEKYEDYQIIVYGHTDNIGSDHHNEKLSVKRAETIKDYLIFFDINPNRIEVVGMGERAPIASNEEEAGRSKNRRVEIKLVKNYNKEKK